MIAVPRLKSKIQAAAVYPKGRLGILKGSLHCKCKRLLPKNAILTYMPPELIEDGEASRLPIPLSDGLSGV